MQTSSVICFDMEHPWHVKQLAGRVSLLLNPSYDWPGLNPYHARVAAFRAVEIGANVVHHCQQGTSLAVDFLGQTVAVADYFAGKGRGNGDGCVPMDNDRECRPDTIVANMPTSGVWTLYKVVGDILPLGCAGGIALLLLAALVAGKEGNVGAKGPAKRNSFKKNS